MTRVSAQQFDDWDKAEAGPRPRVTVPRVDVLRRADDRLPALMQELDVESAQLLEQLRERDARPAPAESAAGVPAPSDDATDGT